MELIDKEALKAELEKARDWCLSHDDPNSFIFFGGCVVQLLQAPTIDPVHAAGGCYCQECKYSSESPSGCSLHEIDDTQLSGFCSYGKPMEQEEGK